MIGDCRCLAGAFGRGLLRQLHKRLHLGREPLIFVVEQLASHGHGAVGDVQAGDTPGGEGVPDDDPAAAPDSPDEKEKRFPRLSQNR